MSPPAALILAGSRPGAPDPVAASEGVAHKALTEVGGVSMLERVARALRGADIERIAISANGVEVLGLADRLGLEVLPTGKGPAESVGIALRTLGAPLLVTTADHALLDPQWVRDFLTDAPPGCDVAVLLARREDVEAAAPGSRRTWLRFADGAWSGCNLFLFASPRAEVATTLWRRVEAERKRPWRLTARIGFATLAQYLLGRLALGEAVARLGRRNGIEAAIVAARDGLAAVDVDRPGDLAQVRAIVAARSSE
ncbi:MAG TPA: nucleotidyltransferase family protein [Novosphingobium sp.]|nr:nucleotidyltransferase family protein [Novosphingobium sp.]